MGYFYRLYSSKRFKILLVFLVKVYAYGVDSLSIVLFFSGEYYNGSFLSIVLTPAKVLNVIHLRIYTYLRYRTFKTISLSLFLWKTLIRITEASHWFGIQLSHAR